MDFSKPKYTFVTRVKLQVPVYIDIDCEALIAASDEQEATEMANGLRWADRKDKVKLVNITMAEPPRNFYHEAVQKVLHPEYEIDDHEVEERVIIDEDGDEALMAVVKPIESYEYSEHQETVVDEHKAAEHKKLLAREKETRELGFWGAVYGDDQFEKDHESPTGFSACTFELENTSNHANLQIVNTLGGSSEDKYDAIKKTFLAAAKLIREQGRIFAHNTVHTDIIPGTPIKFIAVKHKERNLMRMIFPDRNGSVNFEDMNLVARIQYEKTGYES